MSLESVYENFISLGAKSYIGISTSGNITCKIKGYKTKLSYLDFLYLLQENSELNLNHDKWFKLFESSSIIVKNTPYNLKVNNNKKDLVFNNGVLIGTRHILIINNQRVTGE